MQTRAKVKILVVVLLAVSLTVGSLVAVRAFTLGDVLKAGVIAVLVDKNGRAINDFINKALGERKAQTKGATKVVPILSLGEGGYIGAAQVVGVPANVKKTKFVVQLESKIVGDLRGKILVPTGKEPEGGRVDRMKGVGVSAVIDLRI